MAAKTGKPAAGRRTATAATRAASPAKGKSVKRDAKMGSGRGKKAEAPAKMGRRAAAS